jgi:glutathione S-transferase
MDTAYRLYGWPGSGSLAIQIALEDLGVAYQRVWVGRVATDLERYRSLNPTGKPPALGLPDGSVMFESAAMLIQRRGTPTTAPGCSPACRGSAGISSCSPRAPM